MKNLKENLLPTFNQYTLPNGMRIIHEPSASKVAYCGFAVDAGTRDELENEQGMAHFVEHLIFKGTAKRKAWHILNRMENVGGDLNAYTNKEETVIYSAFLTEHFGRAFELLVDIVFHSTFPQREIEKETEVIIDEIQSYEDNPSELIFDDFEDLIFRGHPLGRNILGNPEQLKQFRSEDAAAFTARFYHPNNMVFFVLGNLSFKKVVLMAKKLLADIPATPVHYGRTHTDTGTFCIYFGCDPADLDYCTRLVYKELKRLRDVRMTSSQLAAAKKQLIGQIGVASDNNENNALGMGKTFLHYNKCETSEAVFHRIEQLTSEALLEVANEMFAEDYLSTLIYR